MIFVSVAVFMGLIGAIYWIASYEAAGSTLLAATVGLAVIPGGFLLYHTARMRAPAAQDDPDADIRDGEGPVGAFPGSSIWPVVIAGGATLTGIGLVIGAWAVIPGLVLLSLAFAGGALESRSSH
ncbi:MAG: hypothetical protein NVS3B12_25460 [Acidimicrobiales bacterium]